MRGIVPRYSAGRPSCFTVFIKQSIVPVYLGAAPLLLSCACSRDFTTSMGLLSSVLHTPVPAPDKSCCQSCRMATSHRFREKKVTSTQASTSGLDLNLAISVPSYEEIFELCQAIPNISRTAVQRLTEVLPTRANHGAEKSGIGGEVPA